MRSPVVGAAVWAHWKYSSEGLVVIGVHTPEFSFEHDGDNVRWAVQDMDIGYSVSIDSDYAVWCAFGNHYWPALYFADAEGRIRHHYFGEGEYQRSEMIIQQLRVEAGFGTSRDMVSVDARGVEAPADWATLRDHLRTTRATGAPRTSHLPAASYRTSLARTPSRRG